MGSTGAEGMFSPGTPRRLKRKARMLLRKAEEKRWGAHRAQERKAVDTGDIAGRILGGVGTLDEAQGTVRLHAWLPAIPFDIYTWIEGRDRSAALARGEVGERPEAGQRGPARTREEPGVCLEERWPEPGGSWSLATWTFEPHDGGTMLGLVQQGVPAPQVGARAAYWQRHVFDALQRLFPA